MSTISVIIPFYNRAQLLSKAVNSVLQQSYQDFEIILVDDASPDDMQSVLNSFKDSRIRYFCHPHNKGAPAARNTGLAHAQGEYIAFLDSDDLWFPSKLEEQIAAFNHQPEQCSIIYCRFLKGNTPSKLPPKNNTFSQNILVRNFVGTFSTPLIRKHCFESSGLMDENLQSCQDWDLWIRMAQHQQFFYIEKPLVHYCAQTVSITRNHDAKYQGLKAIKNKYAAQIKQLPKQLKAQFHFNIGVDYYWNHDFYLVIHHFIYSLIFAPSIIIKIISFAVARIKNGLKRSQKEKTK